MKPFSYGHLASGGNTTACKKKKQNVKKWVTQETSSRSVKIFFDVVLVFNSAVEQKERHFKATFSPIRG